MELLWMRAVGIAFVTKLQFDFDGKKLTAQIADTDAAQELLKQLPLDLEVSDFANAEKIANLPSKLKISAADRALSGKGEPGVIAYYIPWGNIAMFYKSFGYDRDLTKLAVFENDAIEVLKSIGEGVNLRITKIP
jgi:hypothetical protein